LQFRRRGGARRGAARPPKGAVAGVSHARRAELAPHHAAHITLRVWRGLPSLREGRVFALVRAALAAGRERLGFRMVHFSVQQDHLHLLAEAADRHALSRGMQGLQVRLARRLNHQLRRRGRIFVDRYHCRVLKTPRAAGMALRYVLLNARKHSRRDVPCGHVDACSSAPWFSGFQRPAALVFGAGEARTQWERSSGSPDPPVASARTWLLRSGYLRAGPFDLDDVPGENDGIARPSKYGLRCAAGSRRHAPTAS
jgi:REP element-mobilizing transposase RayT